MRHRLLGNTVKIRADSNDTTMVANIFMGLRYHPLCKDFICGILFNTHDNPRDYSQHCCHFTGKKTNSEVE